MSPPLLTPEQRHIVGHAGKSILINAVAGSGKTTTLAHCAAFRERQGTDASRILVLVFTPAAETVFRSRLAEAGASRNIRVSTYSAFARSLLEAWRASGAIDGAERYLATPEAIRANVFEAISLAADDDYADRDYSHDLTNLHAEIVINQLSRLKGTLALRRFAQESDSELADSLDLPRGLVSVCRYYEKIRHVDQGSYAFQSEQDLVPDALSVIAQQGDYLELPKWDLIVADEWHDANAAQIELLHRLATAQTRVIAAGDREQVVHSWNGADPRYMGEAFAALFPETRWLPLTASFRCGPTLSAGAAALIGQPFVSARCSDTAVKVERYDGADPAQCARQVTDALRALTTDATKATMADCAVLLRDHHQSIAIENALIEAGIAYANEGFVSYFNRTEVLMLRGILHIVQGTIAPVKQAGDVKAILRALGLYAGLHLTENDWAEAEKTIARDPETLRYFYTAWLREVRDFQEKSDAATVRWRRQFATVCDFLAEKTKEWTAGQLLAYAAKELNIADATRRLFVTTHQARTVSLSVDGFIAYALRTGLPTQAFLDTLESAQARSGVLKKNRYRITLATAREAKGKEWKYVLMPYLVNGEFPDTRAEPGEERRLFYVAITRASEALYLFTPVAHDHHFIRAMRLETATRTGAAATAPAVATRIYLNVPFAEKEAAKQLGARWDTIQRRWWIATSTPSRPFAKWLPADGAADTPTHR